MAGPEGRAKLRWQLGSEIWEPRSLSGDNDEDGAVDEVFQGLGGLRQRARVPAVGTGARCLQRFYLVFSIKNLERSNAVHMDIFAYLHRSLFSVTSN